MEDKKSRKERNREGIIKAALELFRSHGFKKVSIEDIARQAGVSPATVYNHFDDKDGLVRAAVIGQFETFVDWYREMMNGNQSFIEKLEAIVFTKTELFENFAGEWLQVMVQSSPEVAQYVQETRQETEKLFMQLLDEGRQQGYIDPALSTEAIRLYFEVYQTGILAIMPRLLQAEDGPRLIKDMISLYINGLAGTKGKPHDK